MVDIPIDAMTKLLRRATLGKLIEGLIHNINGPMQNLGLDIEMTHYQLSGNIQNNNEFITKMRSRIKRIEQEFNRLEHMIKTTSIRSDSSIKDYNSLNINDFIEQELDFLEANLYFKHNVHKDVVLQEGSVLLEKFPSNFPLALGWFLQSVIEEIENKEIKILRLRTDITDSRLEVTIITEDGKLSEDFTELLTHDFTMGMPEKTNQDMGTILALMILDSGGISVTCQLETRGSMIRVIAPVAA